MAGENDKQADFDAPGWDAIDRWVGSNFRGHTPHQFTSQTPYDLDSPSPLAAITVWPTRSPPGWIYVTYGLSELFEKSSPDPAISGFGFELTFRIPAEPGFDPEAAPPVWPLRLLQSLGHHLLSTGGNLDSGHCFGLGAPLVQPGSDGPSECILDGLVCIPDPILGKIDGPNGSLLFLRLFGVTSAELDALAEVELGSLVACIAELESAAVTDASRASFTDDPELGKIIRRYRLGIEL